MMDVDTEFMNNNIEGLVQEGPKYKIAVVGESGNKNSICNIKSGFGQRVL